VLSALIEDADSTFIIKWCQVPPRPLKYSALEKARRSREGGSSFTL